MAVGTVLGILSLLTALGSAGAGAAKSKKVSDYTKARDQSEKERREELEADQRRAALQRAIKSKDVFSGQGQSNIKDPRLPNTDAASATQGGLSGLSQILGNMSGQSYFNR